MAYTEMSPFASDNHTFAYRPHLLHNVKKLQMNILHHFRFRNLSSRTIQIDGVISFDIFSRSRNPCEIFDAMLRVIEQADGEHSIFLKNLSSLLIQCPPENLINNSLREELYCTY